MFPWTTLLSEDYSMRLALLILAFEALTACQLSFSQQDIEGNWQGTLNRRWRVEQRRIAASGKGFRAYLSWGGLFSRFLRSISRGLWDRPDWPKGKAGSNTARLRSARFHAIEQRVGIYTGGTSEIWEKSAIQDKGIEYAAHAIQKRYHLECDYGG